jgi:hypothetical protein
LGTVTQEPWRLAFNSDSYTLGAHTFSAVGRTSSGQSLTSNSLAVDIVSGGDVFSSLGLIVGAVVAVIVVSMGVITLAQRRRGPPQRGQGYGLAGGAICPKCGRAFPRSMISPNLFTGKLERCPHCGKWSVVRAASGAELAAADAREAEAGGAPTAELSEEERLRRRIEESKYQ